MRSAKRNKVSVRVTHSVKTCPCGPCKRRREKVIKLHKVLHSRSAHLTVFVLVAVGLAFLPTIKLIESIPFGAVMTKAVELLGEIVADRMLPDTLLRG